MSSPLKVALLTHIDPNRRRNSWATTVGATARAIERSIGPVIHLGAPPINYLPYRLARKGMAMLGRTYSFEHDLALGRRLGAHYSRLLAASDADLVYAPAASQLIAFLETDKPIIYFSDATWELMQDYYDFYSRPIGRTARGGEELERRAIERSSIMLFASQWAADSAIAHYGADPKRIYITPFAANLGNPPSREEALRRQPVGDTIRLLMVGVFWERKGGDIALETLVELLKRGRKAELTVVGCTPPKGVEHPAMRVIPFLRKDDPEQAAEFERLWREASFFILPSRSEAAGIVFAEASAHALPSIASNTGGIPSMVVDGVNGYTIPVEARGDRYAGKIIELADDPERYRALCVSARRQYEQRLNFDAWGADAARGVREQCPELADRLPKPEPGGAEPGGDEPGGESA